MDLQEVTKKCTEKSQALFPQLVLMLESCITIVCCQYQEIDIGTIHRASSDFTGFTCTHLCLCIYPSKQFFHTCRFR